MDDVLLAITKVGMLAFVVAGMLSMGLKLTVASVIAPLKDARLVVGLVLVNFVVVPAVLIAAAKLLPMDEGASTAVILMACCAGAPFLPTLAKLAKADIALSVGSMVLLMVLTVAYAPFVVPRVVEGATVSAWDIASSLIVLMLVPLVVGFAVRARYPEVAGRWEGPMGQLSTVGLGLGIVAALLVGWREVLGSLGSWIFVGTLLVVVVGFAAGHLGGWGRSSSDRALLGFAAAQRNISAAIVIAVSLGSDVVVLTLVAAIVLPVVLILAAAEVGRRRAPAAAAPAGPAASA